MMLGGALMSYRQYCIVSECVFKAMDWNTPAFANDSKYWVQMIKVPSLCFV